MFKKFLLSGPQNLGIAFMAIAVGMSLPCQAQDTDQARKDGKAPHTASAPFKDMQAGKKNSTEQAGDDAPAATVIKGLVVDSQGRVGIGIATPSHRLEVLGDDGETVLVVDSSTISPGVDISGSTYTTDLHVSNSSLMRKDLTVGGNFTAHSVNVTNDFAVSGPALIAGKLTVANGAVFNDNVTFNGKVTGLSLPMTVTATCKKGDGPCTAEAKCPTDQMVGNGIASYILPDGGKPAYGICASAMKNCVDPAGAVTESCSIESKNEPKICDSPGWERQMVSVIITCVNKPSRTTESR